MPYSRTHRCGELRPRHVNREVVLAGWVQGTRDHGKLIFADLRDRTGLIQLVFDYDVNRELFAMAEKLRSEYVVAVAGKLVERSKDTVNPALDTGEVEVKVEKLEVLNTSRTPPFYIEDGVRVDENIRLRYRYLDLRRPEMFKRLHFRHRAVKLIRDHLDREGFLEVETPMLTRSTPEGARDFLVPSRLAPGEFYALPQSPQLFKQLLMISGVEKYFQMARCFRDEDLRADRQPEFTQMDLEMSFVDREDIFQVIESMIGHIWQEVKGEELSVPFPRINYRDSMNRFGSDKPDLRLGMELKDLSDLAGMSEFRVFTRALETGGVVKGLRVKGGASFSRKEIDDLTVKAREWGAKGLAWILYTPGGWKSPITKFFSPELLGSMGERLEAEEGDLLLFVADGWEKACRILGQLRVWLGKCNGQKPYFIWVVDFPLLEYDPEEKRYMAMHHPFTAPLDEDMEIMSSDPLKVRARAYDLVLNGVEIGGGSIRIHRREVQEKMFALLGIGPREAEEKFDFFLEAFDFGTPPHGGIALGLDRLIMLLTGDENIREIIPFPKTASGSCLMTGAPAPVAAEQLADLKISVSRKQDA